MWEGDRQNFPFYPPWGFYGAIIFTGTGAVCFVEGHDFMGSRTGSLNFSWVQEGGRIFVCLWCDLLFPYKNLGTISYKHTPSFSIYIYTMYHKPRFMTTLYIHCVELVRAKGYSILDPEGGGMETWKIKIWEGALLKTANKTTSDIRIQEILFINHKEF